MDFLCKCKWGIEYKFLEKIKYTHQKYIYNHSKWNCDTQNDGYDMV